MKQDKNIGHATIDVRRRRVSRSKHVKPRRGSRNKGSTLTGDGSVIHRLADCRNAGIWRDSNLGTIAEAANPYSGSNYVGTGLLEDPVIIAATRAVESGLASAISYGAQSPVRSAIPAMESQMFSFKTRWFMERRDASRARQKLMRTLGVGSKRMLKDPVGGTVVPMSGMGGRGAPLVPKRPQVSPLS